MVFEIDRNFQVTFVNNQAFRMLGISPEDVLQGFNILSAIEPSQHLQIIDAFRKTIYRQQYENQEYIFIRKDKSTFPARIYTDPIYCGSEFRGVRGLAIDITDQKKREERLKLLAGLLDLTPASVTVHDAEGNFLYANATTFHIHGYSEEEFYQKNLHELDAPVSEVLLNERINRAIQEKLVFSFEVEHICRNGSKIPLLISSKSVYWEGNPVILSVGTDITEQKQREEEIAFINILLDTQNETSLDAILIVDENEKIVRYNRKFVELTNIPEYILATGRNDLVLEHIARLNNDPEKFLSHIKYLHNHKEEKSFEEHLLIDGTVIERYSAPLLGDEGKYYGRVWYLRDITKRKRSEEALKKSESTARALTQNPLIATILIDPNGICIDANETLSSQYSRDASEFLGRSIWNLMPPDLVEERRKIIADILRTKEAFSFSEHRNGKWFDKFLNPIFDENGEITSIVAIIMDISQQKNAEHALRESEEKFKALFEKTHDALVMFSKEGCIECNQQALDLFGYPLKEEFLGLNPPDVSPLLQEGGEKSVEAAQSHMWTASEKGVDNFKWLHQRKDGSLFFADVLLSTFEFGNQQVFLASVRDITERKGIEEIQKKGKSDY